MKKLLPLALLLPLTACGAPGSGFENPFIAPLTLTLTPSAVTLAPGASTHVSVTAVAGTRPLPSPTLEVTNAPGVSATPDATGLTVSASLDAAPGTYGLTLQGTVPGGTGTATLNVTVSETSTGSVNP